MQRREGHAAFELDHGDGAWAKLRVRLLMLAVLGGGAFGAYQAFFAARGGADFVQTVELIGPAPPAKPEEEPPPEPEPEEVDVPEVEVQAETPQDAGPASDDRLGLDGDGGLGADAFGLLAKKGGRDITTLSGEDGDGAGLSRELLLFVAGLRSEIERELSVHVDLRKRDYVAVVKLWIDGKGAVRRYEIAEPPRQPDMALALERALGSLRELSPPPGQMPQPIWLRITSRMTS